MSFALPLVLLGCFVMISVDSLMVRIVLKSTQAYFRNCYLYDAVNRNLAHYRPPESQVLLIPDLRQSHSEAREQYLLHFP